MWNFHGTSFSIFKEYAYRNNIYKVEIARSRTIFWCMHRGMHSCRAPALLSLPFFQKKMGANALRAKCVLFQRAWNIFLSCFFFFEQCKIRFLSLLSTMFYIYCISWGTGPKFQPSGPSTGWGDGWVREEGGLSISGVRQGSLDSIIQLGKKPIQYPEPEQVMDSPGVSGPKLYLRICTVYVRVHALYRCV